MKRKDLKLGDLFRYSYNGSIWVVVEDQHPASPKGEGTLADPYFTYGVGRGEMEVFPLEKKELKPSLGRNPDYYRRLDPEPITVITAWELDYCLGAAVKYIGRAGHKAGNTAVDDLQKAVDFLNYKIEQLKGTK